jgi:hypothetical protein
MPLPPRYLPTKLAELLPTTEGGASPALLFRYVIPSLDHLVGAGKRDHALPH